MRRTRPRRLTHWLIASLLAVALAYGAPFAFGDQVPSDTEPDALAATGQSSERDSGAPPSENTGEDLSAQQGDASAAGEEPTGSVMGAESGDSVDDPADDPVGDPADSGAAIAASFGELSAYVRDATTGYIQLGADIVMTADIAIPASKTTLVIDGAGRYTLEQASTDTFIVSATSNGTYTLQNMEFIGRDYYGVFMCADSSVGHDIRIHDVSFSGPQLIYNHNGTVSFSGDNAITIRKNGAASNPAQEVAEVRGVSVDGNLTIAKTGTANSFFFFFGSTVNGSKEFPYLRIEDGATATIATADRMNGLGVFYTSAEANPFDISVGIGSQLIVDVTGANPLCTGLAHMVRSLHVEKGGSATLSMGGGVIMSGAIKVDQGATLRMNYLANPATGTTIQDWPLIWFRNATALSPALDIDRPKALVLSKHVADSSFFYLRTADTLRILTTDFNYWDAYADAEASRPPTWMWSSAHYDEFTADFAMGAGWEALEGIESSDATFASAFSLGSAAVIQLGTNPFMLNAETLWGSSTRITGMTEPHATVHAAYTSISGEPIEQEGTADERGFYGIGIPVGTFDETVVPRIVAVSDLIARSTIAETQATSAPQVAPITQVVDIGDPFTHDGSALVDIVELGAPGDARFDIVAIPDTTTVGPKTASVTVTNSAGKGITIAVPVFVKDVFTTVSEDAAYALRGETVKALTHAYPTDDENAFVLSESKAQAWDIAAGTDISTRIAVSENTMENVPGTYSAKLSLPSVDHRVLIIVEEEAHWIKMRIPTSMVFGSIDVAETQGEVVSPAYEMENGSAFPVEVGLAGFAVLEDAGVSLIADGEGLADRPRMKLGLIVDGLTVVEYLHALAADEGGTEHLASLASGASASIRLAGTYYGTYPDSPLRPRYIMTWSFGAAKP